jgi:Bacterial SH3 domain
MRGVGLLIPALSMKGVYNMNTGKRLLLSGGIVALSTGWAAAAPAVVLDFLYLHSGPGFNFRAVDVIPPGGLVNARNCSVGWCQVKINGVIGYVDSRYLDFSAPPSIAPYGAYSALYSYWFNPYGYYYRLNLLCVLPPRRQQCVDRLAGLR